MEPQVCELRPRKRLRQLDKYKWNIAKKLRNNGKAYVNWKGKMVNEKTFQGKNCECRKQRYSKITIEERRELHKHFWDMGAFRKQNAYYVDWCNVVMSKGNTLIVT